MALIGIAFAASLVSAAPFEADDPVVIVQGPTWEEAGWGPYQFPRPFKLADGRIAVSVHVSKDSFTTYGDPCRWFVSADQGKTWSETSPEIAAQCGLRLPNGEVIFPPVENSIELKGWRFTDFSHRLPDPSTLNSQPPTPKEGEFPIPDGVRSDMFGNVYYAYRATRLAPSLRTAEWTIRRLPAGATVPIVEKAKVVWPNLARVVGCRGGFKHPVLKSIFPRGDLRLGPDGAIYITAYTGEGSINLNGQYSPYYAALIFRSTDNGHTFTLHAQLDYPADGQEYPYASGGFSDSDIEWTSDGTMLWFLRSNWYGWTGEEWSPMYVTRSRDGGKTWEKPRQFSKCGTLPRLTRLANGKTVLLYGRPGIFLSTSDDPQGERWSEPLELMTPKDRSALANPGTRAKGESPRFHDYDGACGNPEMLAMDDGSVLVFYGDFYVPDAQGVKRKSILCRRVRISSAPAWPKPAREAKPWVYNWWMGSAVDAAGLEAQCTQLADAGFGGFHVIPIYGAKGYEAQFRRYLSSEWLDAWNLAVATAKRHDLGVDLTTGCGWCFGGPQLKPEQGCWKLDSTNVAPYVTWSLTGQQVKRAGLGGQGPMMDPFSTAAIDAFLKPFSVFDDPKVAKPLHLYHDSWEYFHAAWSPELFDAFQRKRGYDLREHLAELSGKGAPNQVGKVRLDYRETLSDIVIDDVFPRWVKWCHDRGIRTRNEAHGTMANWLDFYAIADMPETEMYSEDCRDILISKFASSAAHVTGKPLVSSESCTWIGQHFGVPLAEYKRFIDRLFLSGVNHLYFHGCCYSPTEAPWPGWCFYAGGEMNPRNPIWHDVEFLTAYITRCQAMFQSCTPDEDVLVYWPLRDYWYEQPGFATPMNVHSTGWFHGQPIGATARQLAAEGYAFDYVSDRQLQSLDLSRYAKLVVPPCAHMPEATRRAVARFVQREPRREPFAANGINFTRMRQGEKTVYFFVNTNATAKIVHLPRLARNYWWMDPMTGEIRSQTRDVELTPYASGFLVSTPPTSTQTPTINPQPSTINPQPPTANHQPLTAPWTLTPLCGGPDTEERTITPAPDGTLLPWNRTPEGREIPFSGTMRYRTEFTAQHSPTTNHQLPTAITLSLGRVEQSARVRLNGEEFGFAIMAPYRVQFDAAKLRPGKNVLEVEVTSIGQNRLRDLGKRGVKWAYFHDANMMDYRNVVRKGSAPGGLCAETLPPVDCGLLGPVTISTGIAE